MTIIKLRAGETVLVSAVKSGEGPDQGLPPPGGAPVDPGYGIDLGLGYVRPSHPIVIPPDLPPPPTEPVDPAWGIDEDHGALKPTQPIAPPSGAVSAPTTWGVKVAWTPVTGWIVVAVPTGEPATPSAKRATRA